MYYGHCLNNMTCTGLLHMETKFEILTQFAIFCNQKRKHIIKMSKSVIQKRNIEKNKYPPVDSKYT